MGYIFPRLGYVTQHRIPDIDVIFTLLENHGYTCHVFHPDLL